MATHTGHDVRPLGVPLPEAITVNCVVPVDADRLFVLENMNVPNDRAYMFEKSKG